MHIHTHRHTHTQKESKRERERGNSAIKIFILMKTKSSKYYAVFILPQFLEGRVYPALHGQELVIYSLMMPKKVN